VKSYVVGKGYGFIGSDNRGPDVFVHASAVQQAGLNYLVAGQYVSFDLAIDKRTRKLKAVNLRLL
jgi:CspA family cold shock protein